MENRERDHDYSKPIEFIKTKRNVTKSCFQRELGRYKNIVPVEFQWIAEDRLLDKSIFEELKCQLPDSSRSTFLMVFSPDGTKVASAHGNHNIYVTDLTTGQHIQTLSGHPRTPWCIAFHPSSNQILASGCLGGEVRVWDLNGGSEVWCSEGHTVIASLAFHPVDRMLVIATYNDLYFWDWIQPKPFAKCSTKSEREKVRYVTFDRLGNKLITGIANPVNIPSQWDRVGVPGLYGRNHPTPGGPGDGGGGGGGGGSAGGGGGGGGGGGARNDPPVTTSSFTPATTTVATHSGDHERYLAFCYRHLTNQYNQLVRRYFNLSRSRVTPTMDRGTDPMDMLDMENVASTSGVQSTSASTSGVRSTTASTSTSTSTDVNGAQTDSGPADAESAEPCVTAPPPAASSGAAVATGINYRPPPLYRETLDLVGGSRAPITAPRLSVRTTSAPPLTTAGSVTESQSPARSYGIAVTRHSVRLTFARDTSIHGSSTVPAGAVTNTTYTTLTAPSSSGERVRAPQVSHRPYESPVRNGEAQERRGAGGSSPGVRRTVSRIRVTAGVRRPRNSESQSSEEMELDLLDRLERGASSRVRILVSPYYRSPSESESSSTTPTSAPAELPTPQRSLASTDAQTHPRPVPRFQVREPQSELQVPQPPQQPQQHASQVQLLTNREMFGMNLESRLMRRQMYRPGGQFVLSRHSNSPFQPRTAPPTFLPSPSVPPPRPEIPSCMSSFTTSVTSSTSTPPAEASTSSSLRDCRNRILFFDRFKHLLRDRIRNALDSGNSTDSTVNYSSIENEAAFAAENRETGEAEQEAAWEPPAESARTEEPAAEVAATEASEGTPALTSWRSGRRSNASSSRQDAVRRPLLSFRIPLPNTGEDPVDFGVRQGIQILSHHIENMQRLCRARIEIIQLQQIRKMWEYLTTQIRTVHLAIQEERDREGGSEAGTAAVSAASRDPIMPKVSKMMRLARISDTSPVRESPTTEAEEAAPVEPTPSTSSEPQPGPSGMCARTASQDLRSRMTRSLREKIQKYRRRKEAREALGSNRRYRYFRVGDATNRFRFRSCRHRDRRLSSWSLYKKLEAVLSMWKNERSRTNTSTTTTSTTTTADSSAAGSASPQPGPSGLQTTSGLDKACQSCGRRKLWKNKRKSQVTTRIPPGQSAPKLMRTGTGDRSSTATVDTSVSSTSTGVVAETTSTQTNIADTQPSTSQASSSDAASLPGSINEVLKRMIQRMETMMRFQREAFRRTEELIPGRLRRLDGLSSESDSELEGTAASRDPAARGSRGPRAPRGPWGPSRGLGADMGQVRTRRLLSYMLETLAEFVDDSRSSNLLSEQIIYLYTLLHTALEMTDLLLDQLNSTSRDLERNWAIDNVELAEDEPASVPWSVSDLPRLRERDRGTNARVTRVVTTTTATVPTTTTTATTTTVTTAATPSSESFTLDSFMLSSGTTSTTNRRRLYSNPFLRSAVRPGTTRATRTAVTMMYRPIPPSYRPRGRRHAIWCSRRLTQSSNSNGAPLRQGDRERLASPSPPRETTASTATVSLTLPSTPVSRREYLQPYMLQSYRSEEGEEPVAPARDNVHLRVRYRGWIGDPPPEPQLRESTFTVPVVQVNDVPVPDVSMLNHGRARPQSPVPRVADDIWRWRTWRPRFLHPRYMGPNPFDDPEGSDAPDNYHYYRGPGSGAMYTVDPVIIADAPMSPHHRIQAWDFSKLDIPDISDRDANGVVMECKIHNDASVDVSNDGHLLVTLLPSGRLSVTTMLGVYSLDWGSLGQLLYKTSLEQNAVSVSLSPTNRHLLVGLASRSLVLRSPERDRTNMAQIYRMEGAKAAPPGATWHSGRGRLVHIRDLEPREPSGMSLNCIRWAPGAGQGLVYGTNTGHLKVLR